MGTERPRRLDRRAASSAPTAAALLSQSNSRPATFVEVDELPASSSTFRIAAMLFGIGVRSLTSKRLSVAVPRRRAPSLANSNSGARGQRYIERRRWRSAHSYTSCIGTEPHPAKASGSNSARTAYILAPEFAPRTVCGSRGTVKINRTSREPHMTRGRTMRNLGARARRGLLPARAFPYSAAIQMLGCASFNCEPEQLSYAS